MPADGVPPVVSTATASLNVNVTSTVSPSRSRPSPPWAHRASCTFVVLPIALISCSPRPFAPTALGARPCSPMTGSPRGSSLESFSDESALADGLLSSSRRDRSAPARTRLASAALRSALRPRPSRSRRRLADSCCAQSTPSSSPPFPAPSRCFRSVQLPVRCPRDGKRARERQNVRLTPTGRMPVRAERTLPFSSRTLPAPMRFKGAVPHRRCGERVHGVGRAEPPVHSRRPAWNRDRSRLPNRTRARRIRSGLRSRSVWAPAPKLCSASNSICA